MAAEIETMFYTREKPWHGLGVRVAEAPNSADALHLAGLDWEVRKEPIYSADGSCIPGYKANIRDTDQKVLGVVTDRYKVIQNTEAFAFTDALLGEGVRYETAGSLQGGRKIWLLAKLPQEYIMLGDRISPYLVFSNTHDGSGSVKVAITPIRVVCNNTLNLALANAKRSFSMIHTGILLRRCRRQRIPCLWQTPIWSSLAENLKCLEQRNCLTPEWRSSSKNFYLSVMRLLCSSTGMCGNLEKVCDRDTLTRLI